MFVTLIQVVYITNIFYLFTTSRTRFVRMHFEKSVVICIMIYDVQITATKVRTLKVGESLNKELIVFIRIEVNRLCTYFRYKLFVITYIPTSNR